MKGNDEVVVEYALFYIMHNKMVCSTVTERRKEEDKNKSSHNNRVKHPATLQTLNKFSLSSDILFFLFPLFFTHFYRLTEINKTNNI